MVDAASDVQSLDVEPFSPALSGLSIPSVSGSEVSLGDLDNISIEEITDAPVDVNCFSCRYNFQDISLITHCFKCNAAICNSVPCNVDALCKLCYSQEQIDSEREDARRKTKQQADKMLDLSRYFD